MEKLVNVCEVEKEGMVKLMGCKVVLFCLNYIYSGELIGVNDSCVMLKDPMIVYETGDFKSKSFKDAQPLWVKEWYVQLNAIESFGTLEE